MPFSNVPVKNPGRFLEQFVKIVQPRGAQGVQGTNPAVQHAGMAKRFVYTITKDNVLIMILAVTLEVEEAPAKGLPNLPRVGRNELKKMSWQLLSAKKYELYIYNI